MQYLSKLFFLIGKTWQTFREKSLSKVLRSVEVLKKSFRFESFFRTLKVPDVRFNFPAGNTLRKTFR